MTDTAERATDTEPDIQLEVSLDTERAATVRVVAASLAADAGFSIDEIDDLRLAISEVFSLLVDAAPEGRAKFAFAVDGATISATITQVGSDDPIELDELAKGILAAVLDEFTLDGPSMRLVKSADETSTRH